MTNPLKRLTESHPSLSRFFILHPRTAIVIAIVIALVGAIAYTRLAVAEYPNITPVTITVSANYTGAGAKVLGEAVGQVLEDQINAVEDIWYYKSTCNDRGSYTCFCVFRPGVSSNIALVNVQNAVKRAEPKLPSEVVQSGITVKKRPEDRLVMYMFMTDGRTMDLLELSNFVEKQVADSISRMDGVALVESGGRTYSMRIWLDPIKLSALNVSISDIKSAIQSQNIQAAAGTLGGEYANPYLTFKVNVKGRLSTKSDFENIVVRSNPQTGAQVKISDIARVELGAREYTQRSRFNDQPGVSLSVYKTPEANAIEVAARVKKEIDLWCARMPEGVSGVLADDTTAFTSVFMAETKTTLFVALALVVLITYLFLQDWRATFIPAIAIPISLLGTFVFMYAFGFTLNVLTMFGLILVIGSLVDDAIVVVENTQALMQRDNLSAKDAAIKSMSQITGAIIATTLVTLACYLPLAFYGGMVGMMYVQFAVTMCVALCLSTVVAIVLSPVLCAYLLRPPKESNSKISKLLLSPFNKLVEFSRKTYLSVVGVLIRRMILTVLCFIISIAVFYVLSRQVPSAFLPKEDRGYISADLRLSEGQSLERTIAVVDAVHERAQNLPGVQSLSSTAGRSSMWGVGENQASFWFRLTHWDERKAPNLAIDKIMESLKASVKDLYSAEFTFSQPAAIKGLGGSSGIGFYLCSLEGASSSELLGAVENVISMLTTNELVKAAVHGFTASSPQLELHLDRRKAELLSLSPKDIFSTLQHQLASFYVNDFNYKGGVYEVKVQNDVASRSSIDDMLSVHITTPSGASVPLSSVASLSYVGNTREIARYNKLPAVWCDVTPAPGVASSDVMRLIENLPLPNGYIIEWGPVQLQEKENEGRLTWLMLAALLFAYLFLVAQYESWTMPISVMLSVVFAIGGAFVGMYLTNTALSVYAQLGCVMLIGLAAKNAILMVEFSKQERESGVKIEEAALRGAALRYRAVMMTAWSFIIGVLPLVFARGAGAGAMKAIGICTCCGMIMATFVGILFVPSLYALFQKICEKFLKSEKKKIKS